jgi:hypothetical protein
MKKKHNSRDEFFTRLEAQPETAENGFKRMLIISEGVAKGHFCVEQNGKLRAFNPDDPEHEKLEKIPMFVSAQTLQQVADSGNARTGVKAKLDQRGDHAGGVTDTFGDYSNFRVEGESVYADLTFLPSTPHRPFVEGIVSRLSGEFGNSIDFKRSFYPGKDASGQKIAIANCLQLASVDLVDSPAATNSLFEEQDSPSPTPEYMALSPEDLAAIGDMINKAVASAQSADKQQDAASLEDRLSKLEAASAEKKPDEKEKLDEDADKKKENDKEKDDDAKLNARIEKAALKVAQETFSKLSTGYVKLKDGEGPSVTEDAESYITTQLSTGCKTRAHAIARMAKDKPDLYAKYRA